MYSDTNFKAVNLIYFNSITKFDFFTKLLWNLESVFHKKYCLFLFSRKSFTKAVESEYFWYFATVTLFANFSTILPFNKKIRCAIPMMIL